MLSPLRNRFGIPGVISVIALVFAMLGGAYAASDNGGSGNATASAKKAKKGPRGPRGPKGPAGPAGAQGPAGPQGPAGAKGDAGAQGAKGDKGDTGNTGNNGQSVTGTPIAAGGVCGVGVTGVKYTLGSTSTNVCNGKNGEDGEDGETGFTETLPPGETETGVLALNRVIFREIENENEEMETTVESPELSEAVNFSFPIPLELAPAFNFIRPDGVAEPGNIDNCDGSFLEPLADPGNLCVYADPEGSLNLKTVFEMKSTPFGVMAGVGLKKFGLLTSTWAVTAHTE